MSLPAKYAWLLNEPGPKMILEFIKIYGVLETKGPGDNPVILSWAVEIGVEKVYRHDIIPWCGLEAAIIAHRAGKEVVKDPLWALNWSKFGVAVKEPMFGDILVFKRPEGGHVGIYIAEDSTAYHVGGGNESDASNIIRIAKTRLYAARRPIYTIQPSNVRKIIMKDDGSGLSSNEK